MKTAEKVNSTWSLQKDRKLRVTSGHYQMVVCRRVILQTTRGQMRGTGGEENEASCRWRA